jgi:hypothetical protein
MKFYKTYALFLCALFFAGCAGAGRQSATPSEAFQKYIDAYDRKDIATMKQTYSKDTTKMYEDIAQKRQIPVDDVIKGQFEAGLSGEAASKVKVVGEKIEGDAATVEVKSEGVAETEKIPLVKENGEWKLALDKYMEVIQKKMIEDMKRPLSSPANSTPNDSSKSNTNQNKK